MDSTTPDALNEMYRDVVMDHFRAPRGRKPIDRCDACGEGSNPVCGDELSLCLKLKGERIEDVCVNCRGCSISVASGSMLAERLEGCTAEEAEQVLQAFKAMMHGEPMPEQLDMGDLDALQGVRKFPVRVKCALLAWTTLENVLQAWRDGRAHPAETATTEE